MIAYPKLGLDLNVMGLRLEKDQTLVVSQNGACFLGFVEFQQNKVSDVLC